MSRGILLISLSHRKGAKNVPFSVMRKVRFLFFWRRHMFHSIVNTLIDKFASAHIILCGLFIHRLQFLKAHSDSYWLFFIGFWNKISHFSLHLLPKVYALLYSIYRFVLRIYYRIHEVINMQPTSCCFTGHRYIAPEEIKAPQAALIKVLVDLIGQDAKNEPFSVMRKVRPKNDSRRRDADSPSSLKILLSWGWAPAARAKRPFCEKSAGSRCAFFSQPCVSVKKCLPEAACI